MPRDWPDPRWPDDKPMHPLTLWIIGAPMAAALLYGLWQMIWG